MSTTLLIAAGLVLAAAGVAASLWLDRRGGRRAPRAIPGRTGARPGAAPAAERPRFTPAAGQAATPHRRATFTPRTTAPTAVLGGRVRGHTEIRPDALCTVCARSQADCNGH